VVPDYSKLWGVLAKGDGLVTFTSPGLPRGDPPKPVPLPPASSRRKTARPGEHRPRLATILDGGRCSGTEGRPEFLLLAHKATLLNRSTSVFTRHSTSGTLPIASTRHSQSPRCVAQKSFAPRERGLERRRPEDPTPPGGIGGDRNQVPGSRSISL